MRAEKREKRQRKSVIYYYIAIVITAFFGTGLSLYLKGGVPFVKEGAPIFMKIAGIVVVLLLTILLYCKAQKRKWKIVGVISIVLLAAAFSWFASVLAISFLRLRAFTVTGGFEMATTKSMKIQAEIDRKSVV